MEDDPHLRVASVCLLHVAPSQHIAGEQVTAQGLREVGMTVTGVWTKRVMWQDRFVSSATETLFPKEAPAGMEDWWQYMSQRYAWLVAGG